MTLPYYYAASALLWMAAVVLGYDHIKKKRRGAFVGIGLTILTIGAELLSLGFVLLLRSLPSGGGDSFSSPSDFALFAVLFSLAVAVGGAPLSFIVAVGLFLSPRKI